MSDKMTCPGCDAHLSSVLRAYNDGEPCPNCGLSYTSTAELLDRRRVVAESRANGEVKRIADEALLRAGRAEAKAERLQRIVDRVQAALAEEEK